MSAVKQRMYALAATWGFFLGMLAASCTGGAGASSRTATDMPARLPAPPGMRVLNRVATTTTVARVWLRTEFEASASPVDDDRTTRWSGMAVADSGRLYALDRGTQRVEAFDPTGTSLGALGGPTQAAFNSALGVAAAGDQLFVLELNPLRLTAWDVSGERLSASEPERFIGKIMGLPDGTLVAQVMALGPLPGTVSALSPEGQEVVRYTELPEIKAGAMDRETRGLWADHVVAAAAGRVYVTSTDAYEVLAFEPGGDPLWAVRAPWPRERIPEELIQRSLERSRRAGRAMRTNVVGGIGRDSWPDYFPALANIEVDGHGRLYVFPFVRNSKDGGQYPVDVYTADGDLIVHGLLPFQSWDAQLADNIYRIEDIDGVSRIARYGIAMPRAVDMLQSGDLAGR